MTHDVGLRGAAAMVGRSYSWFHRSWRTLKHDGTGQPFPRPYIGAEPGGRPLWCAAAIDAWKQGLAPQAQGETGGDLAQRPPANDPAPLPITDPVSALVAAAGG